MKVFWSRFSRNRGAVIGLGLLALVTALALIGPLLAGDPWRMVQRPFLPPFQDAALPLGTDALGRDVASQMIHGARVSLMIGLVSTLAALAIGVPVGAVAGYFPGWVDDVLMRMTEFFQTIPSFALAIVLLMIFQPQLHFVVLAIAIVSWPPVARLVRGEVLGLRGREFVEAGIVQGLRHRTILIHHVMPGVLAPIIILASLMVATAILLESSLSFLGLSDPNVMSWGYMIGAARTALRTAWWLSFIPGIAIVVTVLALNLVGEGLNDALNPKLNKGDA